MEGALELQVAEARGDLYGGGAVELVAAGIDYDKVVYTGDPATNWTAEFLAWVGLIGLIILSGGALGFARGVAVQIQRLGENAAGRVTVSPAGGGGGLEFTVEGR